MTADGSKVFFTTTDTLASHRPDTDTSADIYEAEVSEAGTLTLTRISTGEGAAPATPTPATRSPTRTGTLEHGRRAKLRRRRDRRRWRGRLRRRHRSTSSPPSCSDGASNGTADQPNLYVARPGSAPRFVATLEPEDPVVLDAVNEAGTSQTRRLPGHPERRLRGLHLDPAAAADGTTTPATLEVYRYDASTETLDCVSCNPTNAAADTATRRLPADGLSLTDDGRVFFNSTDALAARDLDEKETSMSGRQQGTGQAQASLPDAGGCVGLISTGTSPFDSSLLGVSADGTDAYFFTRDTLVPQDQNGTLTKIYDARELGGFPFIPRPPPCKASDECHGPGSQRPTACTPAIGTHHRATSAKRSTRCKTGFVSKHGNVREEAPQVQAPPADAHRHD